QDGWILSALTPSTATLTKAGASRTVGLNPAGAVGGPAQAVGGAAVTVVSNPTSATDPAAQAGETGSRPGLTIYAPLAPTGSSLREAAARTDQAVRDSSTAVLAAQAALAAATPENRPAAQQAMNQAVIGLVTAQNDQIRAHGLAGDEVGPISPLPTPR
ncbi:MAG: hypothetical protein JWM33_3277, partial [Caulobacteraceae bacterium]|nr:hypothetical protein [Caulobacteraceae bacterium]